MSRDRRPDPGTTTRLPHGAPIVAASLVGLFIAGEFVTIGLETAPRPALSRTALQPVLPAGAASAPLMSWTNADPPAAGEPVDPAGRKPLLVAACQDGGSIAIELSNTTSITIDCSDPTTAGPIALDDQDAGSVQVETSVGNPRYIVELLASRR